MISTLSYIVHGKRDLVHLFIPQICVSDVLDKIYPIMELYSSCGGANQQIIKYISIYYA